MGRSKPLSLAGARWSSELNRIVRAVLPFGSLGVLASSAKLHILQIGVQGAEFIADCLKYNTTLSTLDLRANGLGDDVCAIRFVFPIVTCTLVHDPCFACWHVPILKGAICLARSFKIINESLTSLDLGFNEIRVSKHIVFYSFLRHFGCPIYLTLFFYVLDRMMEHLHWPKHLRLMKIWQSHH